MTISGTYVTPTEGRIPDLHDLAYGLKQIVRFAGQTVIKWTVLEHLLAGMLVARQEAEEDAQEPEFYHEELYFGLHDVHEALTSDVPYGFKTGSFEALQAELDVRIAARFGVSYIGDLPLNLAYMKDLDRRMLVAEAFVVTPQATFERCMLDYERVPRQCDVDAVHAVLTLRYPDAIWVERMTHLIRLSGGQP